MDPFYLVAGLVGLLTFPFIWWIIKKLEHDDPLNKFFRQTMKDVVKKQMNDWFPNPPITIQDDEDEKDP